MRTKYECPVEECGKAFSRGIELRSHMAGTMQYDDDHKWENVPISHTDQSAAKVEVPGISDYGN